MVLEMHEHISHVCACRMGKVYTFLGVSVDVVQESYMPSRKRQAFKADITYLTASTLGFTFLADTSSAYREEDLVICNPPVPLPESHPSYSKLFC